jgi:L-ribulose-5-phosphate 3-epimerase UlaE
MSSENESEVQFESKWIVMGVSKFHQFLTTLVITDTHQYILENSWDHHNKQPVQNITSRHFLS